MLSYGNIQMMAEGLLDFLDSGTEEVIKSTLKAIADLLGEIPIHEPDKQEYADKLKLGQGQFPVYFMKLGNI